MDQNNRGLRSDNNILYTMNGKVY